MDFDDILNKANKYHKNNSANSFQVISTLRQSFPQKFCQVISTFTAIIPNSFVAFYVVVVDFCFCFIFLFYFKDNY